MIPERTVARLSRYRRLLEGFRSTGRETIYSHELAAMSRNKASQVRRDLMAVGYSGSPARGYRVGELVKAIDRALDGPGLTRIVVVGAGNLGRAVMHYFAGRRGRLEVVAAFDRDLEKVGRVVHGCPVLTVDRLAAVVQEQQVQLAVVAVPAEEAQEVADRLVMAGVRGFLNFAPVPLRVPRGVFVEDVDMIALVEKVAYFARKGAAARETNTEEEA